MTSALPPSAGVLKTIGPKRLEEGATVPDICISAVNPVSNEASFFLTPKISDLVASLSAVSSHLFD